MWLVSHVVPEGGLSTVNHGPSILTPKRGSVQTLDIEFLQTKGSYASCPPELGKREQEPSEGLKMTKVFRVGFGLSDLNKLLSGALCSQSIVQQLLCDCELISLLLLDRMLYWSPG